MQNTEQTVPSTLEDKILIDYNGKKVKVDIYSTPLGKRFIEALRDNLKQKRVLEKNFCFLGWADSKRNLNFLCRELNKNIEQINSFNFDPPYQKIEPFVSDDFQYSRNLPVGNALDGDIKKTLPIFLENKNIPPIGAIFFDLDFYSSTKESFRIFEINQNFRLPRIKCYFDDIQPPSNNFNSIFKAINEFNVSQKNKKIVKPSGSTLDYKYGPWNEEFYEFHDFKHDKYNNKIFKTIILTEL